MARRLLFFVCITLLSCPCKAQNSTSLNIDSIGNLLTSAISKDSNRVTLLMEYSQALINSDLNASFLYGRQAIELSKDIKWQKGLGNSLLHLGNLQFFAQRYDSALSCSLDALKVAERTNNMELMAEVHSTLTENYRLMGNNDSLMEYHAKKYLEIANMLNDKKSILEALVILTGVYQQMGLTEGQDSLIEKALKMAVQQNDDLNLARLIETKAYKQYDLGKFREAAASLRQVLSIWTMKKNYAAIGWIQSLLSSVYLNLENRDSASLYAFASLKTAKDFGLKKELADAYRVLVDYHYTYNDYKKALGYRIIFDSLQNETFNASVTKNTEHLRMEYEQEKKEATAKAEQAKKDAAALRTRNMLFMVSGIFILIASFLLINNRQKQKAKAKIETAYAELKSAQSQLVQSEKMASLGELTAGIAHEIQNPLNFVNNFSEVSNELIIEMNAEIEKGGMEEAKTIAADISQNLEKINHHGKRAAAIVKGMLQHSRGGSAGKEPTDINKLSDDYLQLAYHGLRAKDKSLNATLKTDYNETIGNINIIPQDIGRVILNLITNAFYAVGEKNKLNTAQYEPTVSLSTKKGNGKIEISVTDNGNGIPANIVDKIFQPFFTTKPTGQGTGLGLSLAYDIVKAHGGMLLVDTRKNEGTTFTIQLPIS